VDPESGNDLIKKRFLPKYKLRLSGLTSAIEVALNLIIRLIQIKRMHSLHRPRVLTQNCIVLGADKNRRARNHAGIWRATAPFNDVTYLRVTSKSDLRVNEINERAPAGT